jgi:outer membrane murein-binding lipoprotein Lpp
VEIDFSTELRGDGDEKPMNVKDSGFVPAVIVGVILSAVQIYLQRNVDHTDSTATNLATLNVQVATLSKQVEKLTEQPYVRRDELTPFENRVTGLEQRVGTVERAVEQRRQ